jgi:hypothetical protein
MLHIYFWQLINPAVAFRFFNYFFFLFQSEHPNVDEINFYAFVIPLVDF